MKNIIGLILVNIAVASVIFAFTGYFEQVKFYMSAVGVALVGVSGLIILLHND